MAVMTEAHQTYPKRVKEIMLLSERIYRIGRLFERAEDVLKTPADATLWLRTPKRYLSGRAPLQYADSEVGAQAVERFLGRIEHGVVS